MKVLILIALTILSLCTYHTTICSLSSSASSRLKEFENTKWFGGSYHAPAGMPLNETISYIHQVGSNMVRITANWRWTRQSYTMDEIQQLQNQLNQKTLSFDIIRQTASEWLQPGSSFQQGCNWGALDSVINATLITYPDLSAVMVIGDATEAALPMLQVPGKPNTVIDPNIIGTDLYLILLYQFNRAQVNRYKYLKQIKLWQLENESNDAFILSQIGVRYNVMTEANVINIVECALFNMECNYGGAWNNFTFVTQVMKTLYLAVKDEDPDTLTTTNVLVDTPKFIYFDVLRKPEFYYLNAIQSWDAYLDVYGFDSYPNHIQAQPLMATKVGQVVEMLRAITSKPIIILETGYPVAMNVTAMPPFFNFTEDSQAIYMKEVYDSVVQAGASGFIIFGIWRQEGITPPPGGFTEKDLYFLNILQTVLTKSSISDIIQILLHFVSNPSDIQLFFNRVPVLVARVENGWGVVDTAGRLRPAFKVIQQMYKP
jgi:hypothetical protein